MIMICGGLVDNDQPFQERYGGMLILHSSIDSDVVTDINVNQIISPQGCCFSFQDSEENKVQSLEKVSY